VPGSIHRGLSSSTAAAPLPCPSASAYSKLHKHWLLHQPRRPCLWLYLQPSLQTVSSRFLPPVQLSISTAFNLHPAIKVRRGNKDCLDSFFFLLFVIHLILSCFFSYPVIGEYIYYIELCSILDLLLATYQKIVYSKVQPSHYSGKQCHVLPVLILQGCYASEL